VTAPSPFPPRVLSCLIAIVTIALCGSLLLSGRTDVETGDSVGANAYSRSAIGHAGLYETLRRLGRPVVRSQFEPLAKLGTNGVLVLAEPSNGLASEEARNRILTAKTILLILPKWQATPSQDRRDWIGSATLLPTFLVQEAFSAVAGAGDVIRVDAPSAFINNVMGVDPTLTGTIQVLKKTRLRSLISTSDGILLGETVDQNRRIWILADPDLIENHGIGEGTNAALAVRILDQLRGADGAIVLDETIHGFRSSATSSLNLWATFPYSLLGAQALIAVLLLLWATMGRFGAARLMSAVPAADKRALIANTAALIDFGGHHAALLKRYALVNLQEAARLLRAPRGLSDTALIVWLDRAGKSRNMSSRDSDLLQEAANTSPKDLPRAFALARSIYFWKRELVHGFAGRSRDL
jgi:hypothetical protein